MSTDPPRRANRPSVDIDDDASPPLSRSSARRRAEGAKSATKQQPATHASGAGSNTYRGAVSVTSTTSGEVSTAQDGARRKPRTSKTKSSSDDRRPSTTDPNQDAPEQAPATIPGDSNPVEAELVESPQEDKEELLERVARLEQERPSVVAQAVKVPKDSPESNDGSAGSDTWLSKNWKFLTVVLLVIAVGAVVGAVVAGGSDDSTPSGVSPTPSPSTGTSSPTEEPTTSPTQEPTHEPSTAPTDEPTISPEDVPTKEPTASPVDVPTVLLPKFDQLLNYIGQSVAQDTDVFSDEATVQYQALDWLANVDEFYDNDNVQDVQEQIWVERYALALLYMATGGDDSWSENYGFLDPTESSCDWYGTTSLLGAIRGVSCYGSFVGELNLRENRLQNSVPTEIGLLTNLRVLNIEHNSGLIRSVPTEIGNLASLVELEVSGCNLSGQIPSEIGLLTKLNDIDMGENELRSTIPSEIGSLTRLQRLSLQTNSLTGTLPSEIGLLTRLTYLRIHWNDLTGSVDEVLCDRAEDFTILWADCKGEVECSCCTFCWT